VGRYRVAAPDDGVCRVWPDTDPYDGRVPHDVLIAIVTYNSSHVVGDLLDSLPAALAGVRAVTVVVDNASTDSTAQVVAIRSDCVLVQQANLGYSAGINRAVLEVPGPEPVLVLNPDVRMQPGSIRRMLDCLSQPGTGVVGPMTRGDDGELVLSMRREPSVGRALGLNWTGRPALAEYVVDPADYERPQVCDWLLGAVLLVDRRCHDELDGWDESFFLYSEETDLCLRARDRGWVTRYEPRALAVHIGGQSGQSNKIHTMQIVNRVRLYRRRHTIARSSMYYAATVLSELSWLLRGHRKSATSLCALLVPGSRPVELGASDRLIPI
jgi:N-acetylglucosaminyl-diphospho-decaprenol L-rhamnosyltransferase